VLLFLSALYVIKLIFDIINRVIQAYKVIPLLIKMINNNENIKSILNIYCVQSIAIIILSLWILNIILLKLSLIIDNVYLYTITLGIVSSLIFFTLKPITLFNLNYNINNYSIWNYLLLFFFIIFYMFILPLTILKIIESEKFIEFKGDYLKQCVHQVKANCIDSDSDNSTIRNIEESTRIVRNNNSNNRIILPNDPTVAEISGNNSGNIIEVVNREIINNYRIDQVRINNTITPIPMNSFNSPSNTSVTSSISQAVERLLLRLRK
jgi:hypothetical protein